MPYIYPMVGLTLFFIFYTLLYSIGKVHIRSRDRIAKYIRQKEKTAYEMELNKSLSERIIIPLCRKLSAGIFRMIPKNRLEVLSVKLAHGGIKMNPQEFLTLQLITAAAVPLAAAFSLYRFNYGTVDILTVSIVLVSAGCLLPKYWLNSKINRRKNQVRRELPGIIDLLTVSMEAGLSFDMALAKIISKSKGLLVEELDLALHRMRRGIPRREALKEMTRRMDVDELTNFIGTILQAEKLGISISSILKVQAKQIREAKMQWAKERGGKAAVKVVIPLVIFILPVIFIVLLGPSILSAKDIFK